MMNHNDAIVDVCDSHTEVEYVVRQFQTGKFDMKNLSIAGKHRHDEHKIFGYYNSGDQMRLSGETGPFWGSLWSVLFGSAYFLIPDIGEILVGGPLVGAIVGAMEQTAAVGNLNAFGVGLYNLGVAQNGVRTYETALKLDKFLVIAHGTTEEVGKARDILAAVRIQ